MIHLPPVQYDHSYAGPVIEQVLSAAEVERVCGPATAACMIAAPNFAGDKCFIVLPKLGSGGVTAWTQGLLRRHEIGHCNGWRHN